MLGWGLSAVVIVSLLAIGLGVLVAPRRSSAQYGIVLDDPRALAFIRAMGARDAVIGGLLALMAFAGARDMLGWGMGVSAAIAAADFVIVSSDRRRSGSPRAGQDAVLLLHAGGAVGLVVTAAVLLAGY